MQNERKLKPHFPNLSTFAFEPSLGTVTSSSMWSIEFNIRFLSRFYFVKPPMISHCDVLVTGFKCIPRKYVICQKNLEFGIKS